MNKQELIFKMAEKTGATQKDCEKMLKAFTDTVTEALKDRDKVQLIGFGIFEARERAAREGQNPATGEKIKIAASIAPAFKAGKALKEAIK